MLNMVEILEVELKLFMNENRTIFIQGQRVCIFNYLILKMTPTY